MSNNTNQASLEVEGNFNSRDGNISSVISGTSQHSLPSSNWFISETASNRIDQGIIHEPASEYNTEESEQEIRDLIRIRVGTDTESTVSRDLLRLNVSRDSGNIGRRLSYSASSSGRPSDTGVMEAQEESSLSPRARRLQRRSGTLARCSIPQRPTKQSSFSYCSCPNFKTGRDLICKCGEEDNVFDWGWDAEGKSEACELGDNNRTVLFHMNYSSGTAAARGTQPLTDGQYFWEIKMTSPVYGTDMMVGLGTEAVKLDLYKHSFTSMLGRDGDSWGLSYYGRLQQKGQFRPVAGGKFAQGSIVGVHADMWRGILTFYINRKPLTEKCYGLQRKVLYPMVSSTAARTSMKIIKACSFKTSLQFLCCQTLRKIVPENQDVLNAVELPPGLRAFLANNLSWLFRPSELSGPCPLSIKSAQKRKHQLGEEPSTSALMKPMSEAFVRHSNSKKKRLLPYVEDSNSSSSSFSEMEEMDESCTVAAESSQARSFFHGLVTSDSEDAMSTEEL